MSRNFFGLAFRTDIDSVEFTIFSFGWHTHFNSDPSLCPVVHGLKIGVLGFHVVVGIMNEL